MEKKIRNQSSSRFFAFASIVVSTISVTGCLLSFPLIFHYLQTLEVSVQSNLDFCKFRSRDMWNAIVDIHESHGDPDRIARVAIMKQGLKYRRKSNHDLPDESGAEMRFWVQHIAKDEKPLDSNSTKSNNKIQCCTCHRGQPGPDGPPGPDGRAGPKGSRGMPGERGNPSPTDFSMMDKGIQQCPCEILHGEQGQPGPGGLIGPSGDPGPNGDDGKPGEQGHRGPAGLPGRVGQDGEKGPIGVPGKQTTKRGEVGDKGKPGPIGPTGSQGPSGTPGKDAKPGQLGPPGWPGENGNPGKLGQPGPDGDLGKTGGNGTCTHCPPPRVPPNFKGTQK